VAIQFIHYDNDEHWAYVEPNDDVGGVGFGIEYDARFHLRHEDVHTKFSQRRAPADILPANIST
jgi:hypothetical protein